MLGGDKIVSILKYILTNECRFLLLRPFMPGTQDRCFPRPEGGGAYLLREAPGHSWPGVRVPGPGR
jgi:hypothetical protein